MDFRDCSYLATGSERQRQAYRAVRRLGLDEVPTVTEWAVAGTIPLGLDLPTSDLDVVVCATSLSAVAKVLSDRLGVARGLNMTLRKVVTIPTLLVHCEVSGFLVEIFAQERPLASQDGFRHLLVEHRLLSILGGSLAETVRGLRATGSKTEPAFAAALALTGDPFDALLRIESMSDEDIESRWARRFT